MKEKDRDRHRDRDRERGIQVTGSESTHRWYSKNSHQIIEILNDFMSHEHLPEKGRERTNE